MTIAVVTTNFIQVDGNLEPKFAYECPPPQNTSLMQVSEALWEVWLPDEDATEWLDTVRAAGFQVLSVSQSEVFS